MRILIFIALITFCSCTKSKNVSDEIFISGVTPLEIEYLTIDKDTIYVEKGQFADTLHRMNGQYGYFKLNSWKWPRIIYLEPAKKIVLNLEKDWITSLNDKTNEYLLNKDSILLPYSARWDMKDSTFRKAWQDEFPVNLKKIDGFFEDSKVPQSIVDELKQMEYMLRGHLTANFISFQEKKEINIDRNIYHFVDSMDLNNERLGFHVSNRNFQYYYYLDKVDLSIADSIMPFAAIDTIMKYVSISGINEMIIGKIVKTGLYSETVNHDKLIQLYKEKVQTISNDDKIVEIYKRIQNLKPGKKAPEFGTLLSLNSDSLTIKDFNGKNILITVWGTWCPYCKEELPHLTSLMDKYPNKFESVAISLDKDFENWRAFISEKEWGGTHLIDSKRNSIFKKNYLISGTNIYYLIDKKGEIIASNLKPSKKEMEHFISQLK